MDSELPDSEVRSTRWAWLGFILLLLGVYVWNGYFRQDEILRVSHAATVTAAAFSADGTLAASADESGLVQIWQTDRGQIRQQFSNAGGVVALAFSPDGRLLAAGTLEGRLHVWEVESSRSLFEDSMTGGVTALAFTPESNLLAAGGPRGTVRLWMVPEGIQVMATPGAPNVLNIVTGQVNWAISGDEKGNPVVWDFYTGRTILQVAGQEGAQQQEQPLALTAAALSPDGKYAASGNAQGGVTLWNIESGKALKSFRLKGKVTSLAFSADGLWLIAADSSGQTHIWSSQSQKSGGRYRMRGAQINAAALSLNAPQTGRLALSGGTNRNVQLWQPHTEGSITRQLKQSGIDLGLIAAGLWLWVAFFAQFILPVRTARQRQQIVDRVLGSLFGRGPAIFVKDGAVVEREGERERRGPGLIWMDSASAGMLRTATSFTRPIGPGIHFTGRGEWLAERTVDLHRQYQRIGPLEEDQPFEPKKEGQTEEAYRAVQQRSQETRALTRDGIEVVPNIGVIFRIKASVPTSPLAAGSRFGYDPESVRRAITRESINASVRPDHDRHHMPWNRLPAQVAADLWREYLSKFTLNDLFTVRKLPPEPPPPPPTPAEHETRQLLQPVRPSSGSRLEADLYDMLQDFNNWLGRLIERAEGAPPPPERVTVAEPPSPAASTDSNVETALRLIERKINERLRQPEVDELDDFGQRTGRRVRSREFELMQECGVQVISVSLSNLRFRREIEEEMIRLWLSRWLESARARRRQLEDMQGQLDNDSRAGALRDHVNLLCRELQPLIPALNKADARTRLRTSLRQLLASTLAQARGDADLQRLLSGEAEQIEAILHWLEAQP